MVSWLPSDAMPKKNVPPAARRTRPFAVHRSDANTREPWYVDASVALALGSHAALLAGSKMAAFGISRVTVPLPTGLTFFGVDGPGTHVYAKSAWPPTNDTVWATCFFGSMKS